jgi:hypothetical protein
MKLRFLDPVDPADVPECIREDAPGRRSFRCGFTVRRPRLPQRVTSGGPIGHCDFDEDALALRVLGNVYVVMHPRRPVPLAKRR